MRDIRRKEKAITDEAEMIKILQTAQYITIAMCTDNNPYLVTLSHGYDKDRHCIYFHCAREGKKVEYLQANSTVWGQALIDQGYVQGSCDHLYATTQFKGNVTFVDDIEEKRHALTVMIYALDDNPKKIIDTQLKEKAVAKVNIGRIDIDYMTGKKADKVIIST
ncbi:MAG: pyridoxamine 5'-phosphate oxidase family protein [Candidatus Hodarchaeota archaeon]